MRIELTRSSPGDDEATRKAKDEVAKKER